MLASTVATAAATTTAATKKAVILATTDAADDTQHPFRDIQSKKKLRPKRQIERKALFRQLMLTAETDFCENGFSFFFDVFDDLLT